MRALRQVLLLLTTIAGAASPRAPVVPLAARPSPHFNSEAATKAWLDTVPSAVRAKSNAYVEGGYWLILWDFLYGAAVMVLLLETKLSARIRHLAERLTRFRPVQSFCYWVGFVVVSAALLFPLTFYEEFLREHNYGLSNQNFSSWFRDQFAALLVIVVLGGVAFIVLAGIVRRFPQTWHVWGTGVSILFLMIGMLIGPVYIAPLFNTYKPLRNTVIKSQILSLARANGISAKDVYEVNASRQSKRVSANVSGILSTERITLNDNLLERCSPEAILAVMGHEMGHYVLHHVYNSVIWAAIVMAIMFAILSWGMAWALSRWGSRWQVHYVGDIAALPLAVLVLSILSFVSTPIGNTYTRTQEYEADIFGLNASRQPDGQAEADLLLGEYRKLDPTPLEEFIFFDHPSGRTRIYAAMRWKAENLCLFDKFLQCKSGSGLDTGK
ncbi:MAG: M48 family metallopeptidase [Bryobacteraceae bacterium]